MEKWSVVVSVIALLISASGILLLIFKSGKWFGSTEKTQENAEARVNRLKEDLTIQITSIRQDISTSNKEILSHITNHIPTQITGVYNRLNEVNGQFSSKIISLHNRVNELVKSEAVCQKNMEHRLTKLEAKGEKNV